MLVFQDLKLKKKYKFVTYTLSPDNSQIVVEKTGTDPEYEAFLSELPETECRYAVYDVEYEAEGGKRNKLCFFNWYVISTHSYVSVLKFYATGCRMVRRLRTRCCSPRPRTLFANSSSVFPQTSRAATSAR
jgi:hypothetical protein